MFKSNPTLDKLPHLFATVPERIKSVKNTSRVFISWRYFSFGSHLFSSCVGYFKAENDIPDPSQCARNIFSIFYYWYIFPMQFIFSFKKSIIVFFSTNIFQEMSALNELNYDLHQQGLERLPLAFVTRTEATKPLTSRKVSLDWQN